MENLQKGDKRSGKGMGIYGINHSRLYAKNYSFIYVISLIMLLIKQLGEATIICLLRLIVILIISWTLIGE